MAKQTESPKTPGTPPHSNGAPVPAASPASPPPPPPPPDEPGADEADPSEGLFLVNEGERSPISNRIVRHIALQMTHVIVYIDDAGHIHIETHVEYGDYPPGVIEIWPAVKIAETRPLGNLKPSDRDTYLLLVARALAEVAEKESTGAATAEALAKQRLDGARAFLREAESFRATRLAEVSRLWTLMCAAAWCLIWLILALICWAANSSIEAWFGPNAPIGINCMAFGVVGAFVSICQRLGKLSTSPESGAWLHISEAGVRLVIGAVAGLAVYLAVQTGIMLKDIATPTSQLLLVYLVALVAGLSERALTTLAAQVPGGLAKDLDPAATPPAPR